MHNDPAGGLNSCGGSKCTGMGAGLRKPPPSTPTQQGSKQPPSITHHPTPPPPTRQIQLSQQCRTLSHYYDSVWGTIEFSWRRFRLAVGYLATWTYLRILDFLVAGIETLVELEPAQAAGAIDIVRSLLMALMIEVLLLGLGIVLVGMWLLLLAGGGDEGAYRGGIGGRDGHRCRRGGRTAGRRRNALAAGAHGLAGHPPLIDFFTQS